VIFHFIYSSSIDSSQDLKVRTQSASRMHGGWILIPSILVCMNSDLAVDLEVGTQSALCMHGERIFISRFMSELIRT